MRGKVEICGVNTAKLQRLTHEEMMELLPKAQSGDDAAREKLICGNLKLVLSVVQRFSGRGADMDDLFQVGCIGLVKAIDHFDMTQDVRLSTYAVPLIIGEVRRYLRDFTTVRVSRSLRDTAYRVLQAREKLTAEWQREPTVEEIAQFLQIPREEIALALDAITDPVSLFDPIYDQGGDAMCVMDQVRDEKNNDDHWLERITLKDAVSHLTERQRSILTMHYFQGLTQMEVSAEIGISQAQVSRLEKAAMAAIRREL